MRSLTKLLCVALAVIFGLAGCTRDTARAFGDSLFSSHREPKFYINAIDPIFNCADVPDPRYPCAGVGPEGFVRDLVVKPFANKQAIDMYSDRKKAGNRVNLTWFSMQGGCGMGRLDDEEKALQPGVGRLPYIIEDADGVIKRFNLAGKIRVEHAQSSLGYCKTGIDRSAGEPMRARLELFAPSKFKGSDLTMPVVHSDNGKFKTGCREEKRNNLTWQVCSTAAKTSIYNRKTRQNIPIDQQEEVWTTQLGEAGFFLQLTVTYSDPIFQYPLWYAERQANIAEVIDTITLETLPYPPVIPPPVPVPKMKRPSRWGN